MQTTTNYGFNIVEGTDMVNPLTQLNPNFTSLDALLKGVADLTVDNATCIKTGTVHAVTRTNTDCDTFKFTATGNWEVGDTMTVDGTLVSVYLADGTAPQDNCFVINTEVIASIQGTRVTLYVNSNDASNISFDDTSVSYTASNVQTAIENASTATGTEYASGTSVKNKIDSFHMTTATGTAEASFGIFTTEFPDYEIAGVKIRNTTTGRYVIIGSAVAGTSVAQDDRKSLWLYNSWGAFAVKVLGTPI